MVRKLKKNVYSPEPFLKHPGILIRDMRADFIASYELAWRLFIRNISAQYRQTILGYLWAFIPPIFMTLIWIFLNSQNILQVQDTGMPYPLFVLTGTILWQTFVDSINSPLKLVNQSKSLLSKVNFPREALILAATGEVVFNFIIRLLLLVIIFIYYNVDLQWTVVLAPFGVISLIALGITIGIILAPISALYSDIDRGILIITQVWFFLTPVIYPVPGNNLALTLVKLNPVSPLLVTTRDWLITGHTYLATEFLVITFFTFLLSLLGWLFYRLAMPHLISRISA